MNEFLTTIPGTVASWVVVATLIIAGVLVVIGLWDKKSKERKKETDGSEDRLIDILQKTVEELEKKVDKLTTQVDQQTKDIENLSRDKETYLSILQGRDGDTKEFFSQSRKSMEVVQSTHDVVTTLATSIADTNTNMGKLIELLGKHVEVIDHAATKV